MNAQARADLATATIDDFNGFPYRPGTVGGDESDARVLRQAIDILQIARTALRALPLLDTRRTDIVTPTDADSIVADAMGELRGAVEMLEDRG